MIGERWVARSAARCVDAARIGALRIVCRGMLGAEKSRGSTPSRVGGVVHRSVLTFGLPRACCVCLSRTCGCFACWFDSWVLGLGLCVWPPRPFFFLKSQVPTCVATVLVLRYCSYKVVITAPVPSGAGAIRCRCHRRCHPVPSPVSHDTIAGRCHRVPVPSGAIRCRCHHCAIRCHPVPSGAFSALLLLALSR